MTTISDEVKAAIYKELDIHDFFAEDKGKFPAIRPARSYAYYNSAKKNSNGEIEIKVVNWQVRFLLLFVMMITLVSYLSSRNLWVLLILIAEVAFFFLLEWYSRKEKVIVNYYGIQLDHANYYWEHYQGAYIVAWGAGKATYSRLVLMKSEHKWITLDLTDRININKLGTAIRDMEPVSWKA
ncbi:hypothetical protein CLV59_105311 [Chitinophaga dinghuensis]|uniref:Uncharacterized protein n=1 Tax=Chitinophaga dinghuensis TaxID=1539050 RepID=A0A327VXY0_9BACT|nr:hypothetical protein [Chitinophaga dinghuensis]RAJ80203.1 hypothetical protein CLV59_105311 [Chitinophaga dinghuensis]